MRARSILAAVAVASAALAGTAPAASAVTTCNTTTGGTFDGTEICYTTNGVIAGYLRVPYSVGSICVGGICTAPAYGTIDVPIVNGDAVVLHGTLCVTTKYVTRCVPYSTSLAPIHIG